MKNNYHCAKMKFCLGHISSVHIHAKFQKDLLNTLAVISTTGFEQRKLFHQDYKLFQPNQNCQDTWAIGTYHTKRCKVLISNFQIYDTF